MFKFNMEHSIFNIGPYKFSNMYTEVAEVKTYYRKNNQGKKKPYYQINISVESRFIEEPEVLLINPSELEELLHQKEELETTVANLKASIEEKDTIIESYNTEATDVSNLKKKVKELETNIAKLETSSKDSKEKYESIIKEKNETIKSYKDNATSTAKLNEDISKLNSRITTLTDEKDEIYNRFLNEKDVSKALLIALNDSYSRNLIGRITNEKTESYKTVTKLKPIEELVAKINAITSEGEDSSVAEK